MFISLETATVDDWARMYTPENQLAELTWTAGNLLNLIRGALDAPSFGWPINYASHCLQAATRAYRANADDETVFCALFHDATEAIDAHNHGLSAAALVRPFVSDENHWMVLNHGLFQNAHCKSNADRFSLERERFRDHPAYERTVRFCADFDQCAFDPGYVSLPLEAFEPLVRHIMIERKMEGIGQ